MSDLTAVELAKLTLHKYALAMVLAIAPSMVFAGDVESNCRMSGGGELSMSNDIPAEDLALIYNPESYKAEFVPGEVLVGMRRDFLVPNDPKKLFQGLDIVEIKDIFRSARVARINAMKEMKKTGTLPPSDEYLLDENNLPPLPRTVYKIKLAPDTRESVIEAIEILKRNPCVAYAEPNYITYLP